MFYTCGMGTKITNHLGDENLYKTLQSISFQPITLKKVTDFVQKVLEQAFTFASAKSVFLQVLMLQGPLKKSELFILTYRLIQWW